jgi:hypothetical protein
MASNTLTDVKNIDRLRARYEANAKGGSEQPVFGAAQGAESQARAGMQTRLSRRLKQSFDHVMLPGRKQRIEIPRDPLIGQTMVLPTRFGSVITASSGTSIHWLSMRTT